MNGHGEDQRDLEVTLGQAGAMDEPQRWLQSLTDVTPSAVLDALQQPLAPFSLQRLRAFLSPAAEGRLEEMAVCGLELTRQRHGAVMNLYAPLYLSNVCTNRCLYCGFHAGQETPRRRLTVDEAVEEARVIASEGFRDILLVSGEDREHVTMAYLLDLVDRLGGLFSSISLELFQLEEEEYRTLVEAGVDGVTLYQETYDPRTYAHWHAQGPKAEYCGRLRSQVAAARSGMRRLGIGALLGLQDWRVETLGLAVHAHWLVKHFWQARVSISFPRLRPAPGVATAIPHPVSDRALVQMILALRLCFPDATLVLSTREPPALRDRLASLGVTQMSAGSKTAPGGYANADGSTEQFSVADTRPVKAVVDALRALGLDPVWKDWDTGFHAPFPA